MKREYLETVENRKKMKEWVSGVSYEDDVKQDRNIILFLFLGAIIFLLLILYLI